MKKRTLLLTAASMLFAANTMAQTDVTPTNWKFDGMAKGSAEGLFIKEASNIGGNFISQVLENGKKGYRWADNLEGAFSLSHWTGGANTSYANLAESDTAIFDTFFNTFQVVDGGKMGNILIYQGINSSETDSRAVKNTNAMVAPNVYAVTQKDLTAGYYKITIPVRMVFNEGGSGKINVNLGTSWWDGLPIAGSGGSGYGTFNMEGLDFFNNEWTDYQFEVEVTGNSDSKYDFAPILIKLGLGGMANNSIIMFDDFKIEKVPSLTLGGTVATNPRADLDDTPVNTGIGSSTQEQIIIFANSNGITVVDATSDIEVYDVAGRLVKMVSPMSTAVTIPVEEKGLYIVKTGTVVRKVSIK